MNRKIQRPVFSLEEQTGDHLLFGSQDYDLLESLYVHPGLGDAISAILWSYYAFLCDAHISPLENYRHWHSVYKAIHQVTQMIEEPLRNLVKTRPDTANLVLAKDQTTVSIYKKSVTSPVYIDISLNAKLLTKWKG